MRVELLAEQGGVVVDGVVQHYGDPEAELKAAEAGLVMVAPPRPGMLELQGDDAQRFCNSMLTNNFRDLAPGARVHTAITDSKARVEALLDGWMVAPGNFLLVFEDTDMEWAHDRLDMYIIMDPIELIARHEEWGLLHLRGAGASEALQALGLPEISSLTSLADGGFAGPNDRYGAPGVDLMMPFAALDSLFSRLKDAGVAPVGFLAAEALRIRAGLPRHPQDIGKRAFPHELGLRDRICSFTKGCYMGQEIINRMDTMGKLTRRLVLVELEQPAEPGVELQVEGKGVGELTSVSSLGGRHLGLGILRKAAWEAGSALDVIPEGSARSLGPVRSGPDAPPEG